MKKNHTFLIFFLLNVLISLQAQVLTTQNVVGVNHVISSEVLKEDKQIQVYLPKGYASSKKEYPVIYLLDGQRFFLYGASLYQTFSEFNLTPDFITVGITNVQANRMRTFSAGAKNFGEYLEKEVISFIEKTYRTSKKRVLFGWAYGGGFSLEILMLKPNLFDGYILSSPYPVSSKIKRFKEFINKNNSLKTFVYFVSDMNEFGVKEGTEEFNAFLSNNKTSLRWSFKVLSGEEHRSTVYPALYHGIQSYFQNYTEIMFSNLEEFNTKGGLNYVNKYYSKRFELYGFSKKLAPFTKYAMIRLAIQANDLNQFEDFITVFKENELVETLRTSWICSIADFYVKKNKMNKALILFEKITKRHPNSIRAHQTLGDVYTALNRPKEAAKAYSIVAALKK